MYLPGKELSTIAEKREYNVYKKNTIIQKGRFSLTLSQQKTLLFLISKITDGKAINSVFTISVQEYCKVSGIKPIDGYYSVVKSDLKAIADASVWVTQPDGKQSLLRWLDIVKIDEGSGTIEITFTKSIQPYLFFFTDSGHYVSYPLLYVLPMSSKYSIRLYELLKSYANVRVERITIEQLKTRLDASGDEESDYSRFVDFRRYVIDRAIDQINQYTDIKVEYEQIKHNRKTIALEFYITKKSTGERYMAKGEAKKRIESPRKAQQKKSKIILENGLIQRLERSLIDQGLTRQQAHTFIDSISKQIAEQQKHDDNNQ